MLLKMIEICKKLRCKWINSEFDEKSNLTIRRCLLSSQKDLIPVNCVYFDDGSTKDNFISFLLAKEYGIRIGKKKK